LVARAQVESGEIQRRDIPARPASLRLAEWYVTENHGTLWLFKIVQDEPAPVLAFSQ
jgi:hypothetical protein